ncbi:MAG: magnesium transporter [Deltaproteobacteria bacterium]|nr:magnesium transporter [Deltaproteobacteria bacterium]
MLTPDPTLRPWDELRRILYTDDPRALEDYLEGLGGGDAARALSRLSRQEQTRVLTTLDPEEAAYLIEEIPEAQAADLVGALPAGDAAAIFSEMDSDEQADLIVAIEAGSAEAILARMDPGEATGVRALASHDPEEAGGLMRTRFLSYPERATVQDVLEGLRAGAEHYRDFQVQYSYIVDAGGRLTGVLRLRDLFFTPPETTIASIMIRDPITVRIETPLEELQYFFERNELLGVPVVDEAGTLMGIVHRHDIEEAAGERADSDFLKSQGIIGEELRSMPLLRRSRRRLGWLSVNILLNLLAASVIAAYQETLAAVIALAVFLPIISDMSGCSGNQAVAVSIRELTLGVVRPFEVVRVWTKEVSVGVINGVVLGLLIAVAAFVWKGNAYLGLVVGAALALNTVVAVSIGGTVPLILKHFEVDPALASGPVLTTLTDMCGFFLVLSLATALLPLLGG